MKQGKKVTPWYHTVIWFSSRSNCSCDLQHLLKMQEEVKVIILAYAHNAGIHCILVLAYASKVKWGVSSSTGTYAISKVVQFTREHQSTYRMKWVTFVMWLSPDAIHHNNSAQTFADWTVSLAVWSTEWCIQFWHSKNIGTVATQYNASWQI